MGLLNKITKLFKKNNEVEESNNEWRPAYESKYNGFVGLYNLEEWWEQEFTEDQRDYIISKKPEITKGNYNYIGKSPGKYLQELSLWFNTKKDSEISLKLLNKAEELIEDKVDLHFMYNEMIKSLYKKRKEDEVYLEKCIEYCKRDIKLYEEEVRHMSFFKEKDTRIPAFQRLAIIYEKREEYQKAIEVCKKAIKYNMREKNKDSFEDRLKRLEKKVE